MQKTPLKYPMLYGFPLIPYPCTSPLSPQLRCTHSHQNTDNQAKRPKSVKFQKYILFCMVSNHSQFGTSDFSQSQVSLPNHTRFLTNLTNPCTHCLPFFLCKLSYIFLCYYFFLHNLCPFRAWNSQKRTEFSSTQTHKKSTIHAEKRQYPCTELFSCVSGAQYPSPLIRISGYRPYR